MNTLTALTLVSALAVTSAGTPTQQANAEPHAPVWNNSLWFFATDTF